MRQCRNARSSFRFTLWEARVVKIVVGTVNLFRTPVVDCVNLFILVLGGMADASTGQQQQQLLLQLTMLRVHYADRCMINCCIIHMSWICDQAGRLQPQHSLHPFSVQEHPARIKRNCCHLLELLHDWDLNTSRNMRRYPGVEKTISSFSWYCTQSSSVNPHTSMCMRMCTYTYICI